MFAISILPVLTTGVGVGDTTAWSSMTKRVMRIIAIPRPNTVHFHIFLRNMPGSRMPRMSPIAGKMKSPYITQVGRPNSVRVTLQPRSIVARTRRANTTRAIRIFLSVGFWASLETRFIIVEKKLRILKWRREGDRSPVACDTHPFQWVETTDTMRPLQMRNIGMAERGRFELPVSCPTHPFQGCALGHYATSPKWEPANSIENSEKSKEK